MANKIASLYAEISADCTKLLKSLTDSKGKLRDFSKGINDTLKSLTGMDLATVGVAAGLTTVANAAKKAFNDFQTYAREVGKAASATGLNVEEMSRFIQVADDLEITQEQLTSAFQMATKNGYELNIDSLSKLAGKLEGIKDPTERAALLTEMFGKNWATLNPMLDKGEDYLRGAYDAVADGLIPTEEAVQQAKDLYAAQDALADATQVLGNAFAKSLTPYVLNATQALVTLMTWTDNVKGALREHDKTMRGNSGTWEEYILEMKRAAQEAGYFVRVQGDNAQIIRRVGNEVVVVQELLSKTNWGAPEADNAARAYGELGAKMNFISTYGPGAYDAITNTGKAAGEATDGLLTLMDAQDKVNASLKTYNAGVLFQIASEGLRGEALAQMALALGVVDEKTAYAIVKTQEWRDEINKGNMTIEAYNRKVWELNQGLAGITSKAVTVRVDFEYAVHGSLPMGGAVGDAAEDYRPENVYGRKPGSSYTGKGNKQGGETGEGRAVGGPGADVMMVGENGPEIRVGGRGTYVLSNRDAMSAIKGNGITVNLNMTGYGQAPDPQRLGASVAREIQRRM